ncbi:hypothetical protein FUA48_12330 [Flavobacterium alkalisoli]|uniref:Uncharacterized protein n=1 Tax=Flavobacterium alkalisoli TaxID=2602769 RepID=A0A5B9FWF3_9FLAO|nr:hypothetical protein [Flavobacterium alkalisoli]QEE50336.1 hypothetical protein FUA48_12330 [Flavobacterium alkalisoli]
MLFKDFTYKQSIFFVLLIGSIGYIIYLNIQVKDLTDSVDDLYYQLNELSSKVDDLEKSLDEKVTSTQIDEWYYKEKIDLQRREIEASNNRAFKHTTYYGLIEGTKYEDYIIQSEYSDYKNPDLSKVVVYVEGTDNVIDYLIHLSGQSYFYYLKDRI